jgi:DNA-directed RNA polymerase subunit omega
MALDHDTMINPPIESPARQGRLEVHAGHAGARRARNINSYFNQLGDGLGHMIPPQVSSVARKPLSIAFEEIAEHKIVWTEAPERTRRGVRRRGRAAIADADGRKPTPPPSD